MGESASGDALSFFGIILKNVKITETFFSLALH